VSPQRKPATEQTAARNRAAAASLPGADPDQEEARRGLVAELQPATIAREDGRTVWDLESYDFLDGEPPDTAHPSLWRLGKLTRIGGLFELAPGFYQLRGFDLSNMHVVEGREGIVVIDPLVSAESAAAALALYREHRGERPVTGLVYTHSHVDHFGGAKGVVAEEDVEAGRVPILAPAGFLHHAVSENVFAGTAMARRAGYMYGARLDVLPTDVVNAADRRPVSQGAVRATPVVVAKEGWQGPGALGGIGPGVGVGPLPLQGLDEALDLAVPARCVGRSEDLAGAVGRQGRFEGIGFAIGEGVIAHHRLGCLQAERCEVLDRPVQHGRRGVPALVTMLLDVGVATVVIDHAVQVDVADSGPLLGPGQVADAGDRMPGAIEARQAGDVDVKQGSRL
jgi:Metallo-beta-lactamase superfamily